MMNSHPTYEELKLALLVDETEKTIDSHPTYEELKL